MASSHPPSPLFPLSSARFVFFSLVLRFLFLFSRLRLLTLIQTINCLDNFILICWLLPSSPPKTCKTREKDTTRAEERRNGGRIRQTKGRRRPRSASTRGADAAKRERAAARLSSGPAERPPVLSRDVTPHYRCHCAATGRMDRPSPAAIFTCLYLSFCLFCLR